MLRCILLAFLLTRIDLVFATTVLPVVLHVKNGTVQYEIGNQRGDEKKLLQILRSSAAPNQAAVDSTAVVVLAEKNASLAELNVLRSVLQKYGFKDIAYYSYWPDKNRMTELVFGQEAVPYTTNSQELKQIIQSRIKIN